MLSLRIVIDSYNKIGVKMIRRLNVAFVFFGFFSAAAAYSAAPPQNPGPSPTCMLKCGLADLDYATCKYICTP